MAGAEAYRQLVEARAGAACEYCRLSQTAAGVTFHIEHVVPRSRGGRTVMNNLAMSCPGCSLAKADRTAGPDAGGQPQPFFNPRDYEPWQLGWHLHFVLDRDTGLIVPRTPMAEATIQAMRMNDSLRAVARKLQILAGLIA